MPAIQLPDGKQLQFDKPVTVAQVAQTIGAGLAKAALAGIVKGKLVDASYLIHSDADLRIITDRDAEGLEIIRHSAAHLLAQAVKELFPKAQVTIGPVIEDGFYYDFAFERPFTPEDLAKIEAKMRELAIQDQPVNRSEMPRDEAIQFFRNMGEDYKAQIIEDIPANETLSLYQQGSFTDLCRGPHAPRTGVLKAFKLMKVAGAYWRGDSKNAMLQRIYGTAWTNQKDLEAYLQRLEEAEKRDHRKIGKALDLFHIQEEGPGMVFWHPGGWTIYQQLKQYLRQKLAKYGYQEINTPIILSRSLWESSGHWDKFHKEMFTTASENRDYAVKPMSCPGHVQIFNQGLKSYKDLPIRYAEFGCCHRNEPSGSLHGIMRVRQFVQDDAHIFCTEDQIADEAARFIDLLYEVYSDFGFTDVLIKLSTRPEQRVGAEEIWDKAESALSKMLDDKRLAWLLNPGEGAFYGPKIEFTLRDCLNRPWQCGTLQLDFSTPNRLGASYVAEDGSKQVPVMLHRAVFGTFERFIGILLEHYAGKLPIWLAPCQVMTLNITDNQAEYVEKIAESLVEKGFRAKSDLRNEKIGFKIREHTMRYVPYLIVIGEREAATGTVSVRTQSGKDLGSMSVDAFIQQLQQDIATRADMS